MKILFVHQNFPGQFKFLAPALVGQGHEVRALAMKATAAADFQGIQVQTYQPERGSTLGIHPWVMDLETKTIRGEACFKAALRLKAQGYEPDVIIAHPGWGESLFIKDVWPNVRLGIYGEFFYQAQGSDVGFDPEFPLSDSTVACRLRLKNLNNLLHFEIANAAISPTQWQANSFPMPFRSQISVIHDGIDTQVVAPNPSVKLTLQTKNGDSLTLSRADEVITFVNRNLEPYRGYHVLMRALPDILKNRPQARVLIVGGDSVSYGAAPDKLIYGERNWKNIFIDEVRPQISNADWARVHFLGNISYPNFISLLQLSMAHVYLTYPFVLSWSLLEAMSAGCAIVASDTAPVREVIQNDKNGVLVDFFDIKGLARAVSELLAQPEKAQQLGKAARNTAIKHYDLQSVCLPRQIEWVEGLLKSKIS